MADEPRGKLARQIEEAKKALKESAGDARLHARLAGLLKNAGDVEGAKRHCQLAVAIDPTQTGAAIDLGNILIRECDYTGALAAFGLAQVYRPDEALRLRMAVMMPPITESRDQIALIAARVKRALAALPKINLSIADPSRDAAALFYLAYYGVMDRTFYEQLADIHLGACPSLAQTAPHVANPGARQAGGRIKVGFVSRFLFDHSIGRLNRGLIAQLDRKMFHVTVAVLPYVSDAVTKEIAASADRAIRVPLKLDEARKVLAREELDVIVYPEIGMDSFTYCLAFARLASVQCATWGHPVTTGIPNMDYFVSGDAMEIEGSEAHYRETLVRLKTFTSYYAKPERAETPKGRADFGLSENAHYYLVAQYLFKVHPDFDDILARILRGDARGRVLMVEGSVPRWSRLLLARFKKTIPDVAERIQFIARQSQKDFLDLIACADVSLDIPHFNGGNTTIEALMVGTPVVTMPVQLARGRLCAAIHAHMGVEDCVAGSVDEYVDVALRLGTKPSFRKKVRKKILANNHKLFNNDAAVKEWERFFLEASAAKGIQPARAVA